MIKKTYRLNLKDQLSPATERKYEVVVTWSLFGIPIYRKVADETLFSNGYNSYF